MAMLERIERPLSQGPASAFTGVPRSGTRPDFGAALRAALVGAPDAKPLDLAVIEILSRTLEMVLADGQSEEITLAPPLFQPSAPSREAAPATNNPSQGWPDTASNYLHGRQDFESTIKEAAQKYGVEPALIKSVITAESGGNPRAVSPAGAQGLMQLMPSTAADLGVTNPFDPAQNVMAGTRYLRQLLDRYHGNLKLALAAYNWGMGNLEKRPEALPAETRKYISRIEDLYRGYATA